MAIVSIKIPQLGEGLQEALLVELLKSPGDSVDRDEPLFTMETDKATSDVESPYAGKLVEWLVEVDSVLEIGTEIALLDTAVEEQIAAGPAFDHGITLSQDGEHPVGFDATSNESKVRRSPGALVAPRTRKFLIDENILELAKDIPAAGRKLSIDDVEVFLANRRSDSEDQTKETKTSNEFDLVPVAKTQIKLNYRLTKAAQTCVPVTLVADWPWTRVEDLRNRVRETGGPTAFAMLCLCVAQAVKQHDSFRSSLTADGKSYKVFKHVNLGIAVGIGNDELVTAVIKRADQMTSEEFFAAYKRQVKLAQQGIDQADESTTMMVSNIGNMGMRLGIPAIVPPAVATLAVGAAVSHPIPDGDSFRFERMISATMAFDHRVANGVGAANFMNEIKKQIDLFTL